MIKQAAMLAAEPRLVTAPVAMRYLGGERPEKFGVQAIQGKRQRLYDRLAIDAALNRIAGLESGPEENDSRENALAALAEEWR